MQLINNDQNLITCSSDLSIKIIDLPTQHVNELTNNNKSHNKGTNIHKLPNIHTDYIKNYPLLSPNQPLSVVDSMAKSLFGI